MQENMKTRTTGDSDFVQCTAKDINIQSAAHIPVDLSEK